jgi:hypothetical protein
LHPPETRDLYFRCINAGLSKHQAAQQAGITRKTGDSWLAQRTIAEYAKAETYEAGLKTKNSKAAKAEIALTGPLPLEMVCDEAKKALKDLRYFRQRYLGRVPVPWQEDAILKLMELKATEEEEYVVVNCPPGSGKSALFLDFALWCIVKDRGVRILFGSVTQTQADKMLSEAKRILESTSPMLARTDMKRRGLALDAEGCLAVDFGRFKPLERDVWTKSALIVEQQGGASITNKDATIQAYGMDTSYIGSRIDISLWDDLVDPRKTRTVESKEELENNFQDVMEARLEPGGLFALVGQRISADDLYRFALNMEQPVEELGDDEDPEDTDGLEMVPKYHHIIYKAHYEELCSEGSHAYNAPAWPNGCLLNPKRITWRKIQGLMTNRAERFQVIYQQEDISQAEVLVNPAWVYGTNHHPTSCMDHERDEWQMPRGPDGMVIPIQECTVAGSVDPSVTNYWGISLWLHHKRSDKRYLIALLRKKMEAPELLDFDLLTGKFTGIMDEWQTRSESCGFPIQRWILEQNAAHKHFLQTSAFKTWTNLHKVEVVPHTTGANKADPNFGVEILGPLYREGKVRLPGFGLGKTNSVKLISEVTHYRVGVIGGGLRYSDCMMSQWFFENNLPNIRSRVREVQAATRPSWVQPRQRIA